MNTRIAEITQTSVTKYWVGTGKLPKTRKAVDVSVRVVKSSQKKDVSWVWKLPISLVFVT